VTLADPEVALVPLQLPVAVQLVALVEDQVSVLLAPAMIEAGLALRLAVGIGVLVTVTAALPWPVPPAPVQASV
jgi:hypothetical protein